MILPINLHHLGALPKSGISFKSFIWFALCFVSSVCLKGEFFFLGLTKQQQQKHQAPTAKTIIICNNNESNNNNVKKKKKTTKTETQ